MCLIFDNRCVTALWESPLFRSTLWFFSILIIFLISPLCWWWWCFPFCSPKMKKAKRRLTVDPVDFDLGCDYIESRQRSDQVKAEQSQNQLPPKQTNLHAFIQKSLCLFLLVAVFLLSQDSVALVLSSVFIHSHIYYILYILYIYLTYLATMTSCSNSLECAQTLMHACELINRMLWQDSILPNEKQHSGCIINSLVVYYGSNVRPILVNARSQEHLEGNSSNLEKPFTWFQGWTD